MHQGNYGSVQFQVINDNSKAAEVFEAGSRWWHYHKSLLFFAFVGFFFFFCLSTRQKNMAEKWLQDFFTQQQVKQAGKQSLFLVTDWGKEMKLAHIKSRFLLFFFFNYFIIFTAEQKGRNRNRWMEWLNDQLYLQWLFTEEKLWNCLIICRTKNNLWLFSPFGHFTCNLLTSWKTFHIPNLWPAARNHLLLLKPLDIELLISLQHKELHPYSIRTF